MLLLLVFALRVEAAPDIFSNREWEPDFRVRPTSLLVDEDGRPREQAVLTCLLSVSDLQLRRCDRPGGPGGPVDSLANPACYTAEYEISLEVFQGKGRKRVHKASRYLHQSLRLDRSHPEHLEPRRWHNLAVDLEPGDYTWWVEFQDLQSRRHVRREGWLRVADLSRAQRALSGLWLVSGADSTVLDPLAARPFVEDRGGAHSQDLAVFYQVWSREADSLTLESTILDRRGTDRHRRALRRPYSAGRTANLLQVPLQDLGSGDYQVVLKVLDESDGRKSRRLEWGEPRNAGQGDPPGQRSARFTVRWRGEPGNPGDLDRAVEQLRYILPTKRFRELQDAPMSQKKQLFDEFWHSVDPSPDNEANELMAEYYHRAEFADRRFSWSRFAGWRSDRGRIYMIHGNPDQVERSEGGLDSPAWERWSYEESGREFFFVDRLGFGDYQLVLDPGR